LFEHPAPLIDEGLRVRFRRVQEVGKGTLVVSLPKSWAKKMGVSKGSILAVREGPGGQLIIEPFRGEEREALSITINCRGKTPTQVEWILIGAYLIGYDTIEVVDEEMRPEVKAAVRKTVRGLAGLEIVDEDSRRVVIDCLVDPSAIAPKTLLARKNAITISMHSDAIRALVEGDRKLAKMVIDRDEEVDRLYFLLVRLLRTAIRDVKLAHRFGLTPVDCLDYRMAAKLVEFIGDHAVDLAHITFELPEGSGLRAIEEGLEEAREILKEMQDLAMKAFLSKREEMVARVKEELGSRIVTIIEELKEETGKLGQLAHLALSSVHLIEEVVKCGVDIADLVIPVGVEVG